MLKERKGYVDFEFFKKNYYKDTEEEKNVIDWMKGEVR